MNQKPNYIVNAHVDNNTIEYSWDSWGTWDTFGSMEEKDIERIKKLSLRARYALLLGASEWLAYRFESLIDRPDPFNIIDVAWAQAIDIRYGECEYLDRDDWNGPVKGPIRWEMVLVQDYVDHLHNKLEIISGTTRAIQLALYVLSEDEQFLIWLEQTISRLERLYPYETNDPLGDPVPREALDPNYDFNVNETEKLLNAYLENFDYEENYYSNDPEEMIDEGFEGKPYMFSLSEDREKRVNGGSY